MNQSLFIVWRESIEALLVIGILHAWISQQPQRRRALTCLWGGVALGLLGQGLAEPGQIHFEQLDGLTQLQHQAAVHRILAGGAEVDEALGILIRGGDALAEPLDQRNRRVAGRGDSRGQLGEVVQLGFAGGLDGRHGGLRNQADARLGAGQGRLEIEHGLHPPGVAEHPAHGRAGEVTVEQLVAQGGLVFAV